MITTSERLVWTLSLLLAVASAIVVASPAQATLGLRETADVQPWMTNGTVYAQALSEDGKTLYIGGKFKQVREKPPGRGGGYLNVDNVAAIDVESGAPIASWKPGIASTDGTPPVVRALAARNGRVFIGGRFDAVGGQARRNLAAVDAASGAAEDFAPTVGDETSTVYALAADASRLYVGGRFANVNGVSRANLAAVDPVSGALDLDWRARANNLVRELEPDPSGATLFAVGAFDAVSSASTGAIARQSVARFDAATGAVHPWSVPSGAIENPMTCWNTTVTPTRLYVGCGRGPNFAAAYRLDDGDTGAQVWRTRLTGNVQATAMSPDGSRLLAGGHFGLNLLDQRVCGDRFLKGLVALDPADGTVDCDWIPSLDQVSRPDYDGTWTILSTDRQVWVGGGFVGVSGEPRTNLARFTYDPDFNPLDTAPPAITRPRPEPGSATPDRTPALKATVRDAAGPLDPYGMELYLDGSRRPFSYDPATGRLSHQTGGGLSYGWHRARVEAEDAAGNRAKRAWSFKVTRGG